MGTEGQVKQFDSTEFAAGLLSDRELTPRARRIVAIVAEFFPDSAIILYIPETIDHGSVWKVRATLGDARVDAKVVNGLEIFQGLAASSEPMIFQGAELSREAYAHIDLRRTVTSWALIPLVTGDETVAALELVSFSEPLYADSFDRLAGLFNIAALAMSSGVAHERERNSQLASISRITQFYDLEKTFNATIEIEELLPVIASKFREILDAQAVNLWMVESKERLLLTTRAGSDPTAPLDSTQSLGQGIAFDVSESGEPVLIDDPHDQRLAQRNQTTEPGAIFSLMAVNVMDRDQCVGVAEVINRTDGRPFDDDDLFLLTTICETASSALHNAALLQSERKAQILETLVEVSNEITSTLNLDRVLQTIVNGAQAVIPFERSAIALEQDGRLQLKAVSGMRQINFTEDSVSRLRDFAEWLSFSSDEIYAQDREDEIAGVSDDRKSSIREYFNATGVRGFFSRPLTDDQGRLGLLIYESSDPDFLNFAHIELIKILSGQATVALRNAQLYQEVPFINILEPILERKRRFMAMRKQRRALVSAMAVSIVLFLVFVPVPLRVAGDATVAPMHTARIQPEFDGVVKRVLVHEGEAIKSGAVIAEMDDFEFRNALAEAEAKYRAAVSEMNRALAVNDGSMAGVQRTQVAYWSSEIERTKDRLAHTRLRSPIDGVVTTAFIENFTGRKLEAGEKFAEVIDTSKATIDVAVDEQDVNLLRSGMLAGVKLDSYPTSIVRGKVIIVTPKGEAAADERMFFARVDVPNNQGRLRAGMQGRGKVMAGWHPAGYVIFRRFGMWTWGKMWSWFGF